MKRTTFLVLALLVAMGLTSCNTEKPVVKSLEVAPEQLTFGNEGGTETVIIMAENIASWKVEHDDWITTAPNATDPSKLEVTVGQNPAAAPRTGEIKVSAEGVATAVIKVEQVPSVAVITPSVESLSFESIGGTQTFEVTTAFLESFEVVGTEEWITATPSQDNPMLIEVTVAGNTAAEARTGSVKLSGAGAEDVLLAVEQAGFVKIMDRSTRELMNIKGDVVSVSHYFNIPREEELLNLQFNEAGMLTSYDIGSGDRARNLKITYDDKNRFTTIENTGYNPFKCIITYSDHGVYIPLTNIFDDLGGYGYFAYHNSIMPLMVKDVSSIAMEGGPAVTFVVNGENGQINYDGEKNYEFTVENGFVKLFKALAGWFVYDRTYEIDPNKGIAKRYSEVEWGDESISFTFNDDAINSIAEIKSFYMGDSWFKYNDNLDVANYVLNANNEKSITYVYDEQGNWVSAQISGGDKIERTIVYRNAE